LEVLREIAVRDRSADRRGTAAQQLRCDGGDALALVGGSGSGRVVDGDVALSGHVAGSVGISIDELDRVGVSGGDDEATEVVDGVVQREQRRFLPAVGGRGGGESAVDLVGEQALSPLSAEGVEGSSTRRNTSGAPCSVIWIAFTPLLLGCIAAT